MIQQHTGYLESLILNTQMKDIYYVIHSIVKNLSATTVIEEWVGHKCVMLMTGSPYVSHYFDEQQSGTM
ncbi:hypothetical protein LCGC14_2522450 [marine sediment metagenome]|uniref:Uncharacterized protein n=1 Tax=marine sediment metagenome TaxID=412755 RepID=A0A0F9AW07_9ZZZZ